MLAKSFTLILATMLILTPALSLWWTPRYSHRHHPTPKGSLTNTIINFDITITIFTITTAIITVIIIALSFAQGLVPENVEAMLRGKRGDHKCSLQIAYHQTKTLVMNIYIWLSYTSPNNHMYHVCPTLIGRLDKHLLPSFAHHHYLC